MINRSKYFKFTLYALLILTVVFIIIKWRSSIETEKRLLKQEEEQKYLEEIENFVQKYNALPSLWEEKTDTFGYFYYTIELQKHLQGKENPFVFEYCDLLDIYLDGEKATAIFSCSLLISDTVYLVLDINKDIEAKLLADTEAYSWMIIVEIDKVEKNLFTHPGIFVVLGEDDYHENSTEHAVVAYGKLLDFKPY